MPYTRRLSVQDIEYILLDETKTGNVAASANEITTVLAPEGYIYEVVNIYFEAQPPAGGAAGLHSVFAIPLGSASMNVFLGRALFGSVCGIRYSRWHYADSAGSPLDETLLQAMQTLRADHTNGFRFYYENGTDVVQAGDRKLNFLIKKVKVV